MSCKPLVELDPRTLRGRLLECREVAEKELVLVPPDRPIHPIEALHLLYRGTGRVIAGGEELDFTRLLGAYSRLNPLALAYYEAYLELRRRGRLPIPGPRENTLILIRSRRNPRHTHYILVLEEGRPVRVSQLAGFIEEARRRGLEPVLAIVDRYGDVTFYTPMVFHPGPTLRTVEEGLEATSNSRPS
jgi:tRNA-intron endonuclease